QPPVGARTALELHRRWGDTWFLEEIFPGLLRWNRWWAEHRRTDRWLGWGSNGYQDHTDESKRNGGQLKGAILESGLDNSPMYDEATFDAASEVMDMADAGLNGLYVMDCRALASIAATIGKDSVAAELQERAERFAAACAELWDEEAGIFLNRHTDTGRRSPVLSPTNFYPLCGGVATQEQAERMVREHLFNEEEFAGDWVLPSIARNAPGFHDQRYWRGRIWGPLNQIVFWGLQEYDLPEARAWLAEGSARCFLKEWRSDKHVHENYNSITGAGCDSQASNPFYHWGALLALIPLIEAGHYQPAAATVG
ncbi:MAG: MGH1-like glycoside hydrolase domain-containing protein, partial [Planctomycetota bacterium]